MNPLYIQLLITLLQTGTQLADQVHRLSTLMEKLQREQRDPTPQEWADVDAAFDHSRALRELAIARRLLAETTGTIPEPPASNS